MFSQISFFYISVYEQHRARKRQVNSRWREACHAFALHVGKNLENIIDTASNVDLKGRPLHNPHVTILKGLKLLMILFKKKEKKDMAFSSKKRFEIPVLVYRYLSQDI